MVKLTKDTNPPTFSEKWWEEFKEFCVLGVFFFVLMQIVGYAFLAFTGMPLD